MLVVFVVQISFSTSYFFRDSDYIAKEIMFSKFASFLKYSFITNFSENARHNNNIVIWIPSFTFIMK